MPATAVSSATALAAPFGPISLVYRQDTPGVGERVRCSLLLCWLGGVEQLPQHSGVAFQGVPAVAGEGDGGEGVDAAAGLVRAHVPGIVELAQVGDQVARCQPDQTLQPGEGQGVPVGQRRECHHHAEPRWRVDDRVKPVLAHRRRRTTAMTAITRNGTPTANASTAQTPTGPANPPKAATAISQMPRPKMYQFSQAAVPATRTTPASSSGADAMTTPITPRLTPL